MRLLVSCALVSLVACGGAKTPAPAPTTPTSATTPAAAKMDTFTLNGYELTGAEYWPYVGSEDIKYPEEVLWGFYPEAGVVAAGETDPNPASARPEAIACAQKAYDALQAFLKSDSPKFRRVNQLGEARGTMVPRFYLWTNDYGRAATPYPPGVREARLWFWKRKQPAPPKPPGYWKWESSVLQNGDCTIPQAAQIEKYLDETLAELEKTPQ